MADNILSAIDNVERLTNLFDLHADAVEKNVGLLQNLDQQYAKVPSDFIRSQKQMLDLDVKQSKVKQQLQKESQEQQKTLQSESRTRAALSREKAAQIRLEETQARQKNRLNREAEREERLLRRTQGLYNAVQRRVNKLTFEYNNLAVKKQLTNKLSVTETARLLSLEKRLLKYQNALKSVDGNIGKFQRNVGNYSSAWNGLGNSLNQLTREAPAFANSVQTGFLAISNNLPILVDEINRLNVANKQLIAQGKPVTSVLSQIGSALFSWQTALSLGVTLLTIYGKEIVEWVQGLFKADDEIQKIIISTERLNEIQDRASKSMANEVAQLDILGKALTSHNVTQEERLEALEKLQALYPGYFDDLNLEESSYLAISSAIKAATDDLLRQAVAKAIVTELEGVEAKRLKTLIDTERKLKDLRARQAETNGELEIAKQQFETLNKFAENNSEEIANNTSLQAKAGNEALKLAQQMTRLTGEQKTNTEAVNEAVSERERANREAQREISLLTGLTSFQDVFNQILDDTIKKTNEATGARKADAEAIEVTIEQMKELVNVSKEHPVSFQIEAPDPGEVTEALQKIVEGFKHTTQQAKISAEEQKEIFSQLFSTFGRMYGIDLRAFTQLFDDKKLTAADYAEAAAEFSRFVLNVTTANYEAELQANRDRLQAVLDDENASKEQKEVARAKADKRERDIRTRQAKAERTNAIIQIGIDTALAVIKATAQTGILAPAFIPTIIALGAAQAAFVAAQPLPRFARGTDSAPEGLAITQEERPEVITDKYGRIKSMGSYKGPQLTYLEKGDKVFESRDQFYKENVTSASIMQTMASQMMSLDNSGMDNVLSKHLSNMKNDVQQGVKDGLKSFRTNIKIENKIDLAHESWLAGKGYR